MIKISKTLRKIVIVNCIVLVFVSAFVIVAQLISDSGGHQCDFFRVTGFYCPGCGGTRAVFAILRFDIASAIKYNVTVPFGIFVYLYYNIRSVIACIDNEKDYFIKQKYILCIILAVVIVLNCIVKNVLYHGWGIGF
ncbi:MAG: DUF2752 domain-containing protein [Clostridia bacterium]|nr:DUF2752 domain-containing protein [Clostridia bacterium]